MAIAAEDEEDDTPTVVPTAPAVAPVVAPKAAPAIEADTALIAPTPAPKIVPRQLTQNEKNLEPRAHTDSEEFIKPINTGDAKGVAHIVASDEIHKDAEANAAPSDGSSLFIDTAVKSFHSGGNFAYTLYKRAEREWYAPPPDPKFDADQFIKYNNIPVPYQMQYHLAGSAGEATSIMKDMREDLATKDILERRTGVSPFVATMLAGTIDLDTPLTWASGGLAASFKAGVTATKWGRYAAGGIAGGLTQGAAALVGVEASTTDDWTSIPAAALGGMALGTMGGMAHTAPEVRANASIKSALQEFSHTVEEGHPLANKDIRTETHVSEDNYGSQRQTDIQAAHEEFDPEGRAIKPDGAVYASAQSKEEIRAAVKAHYDALDAAGTGEVRTHTGRKPEVFKMSDVEVIPDSIGESGSIGSAIQGEGASVGARQMNPSGSTANMTNARSTDILNRATARDQRLGVSDTYFEKASNLQGKGPIAEATHNAAIRFHDVLSASGIATDFDRFMKSGSTVAKMLAYDLMESASGIVRNNRSAAMIKDLYEKQLLGTFMMPLEDGYKMWAKKEGMSWYDRLTDMGKREQFHREVVHELQGRAFDPPGTVRNTHESVKMVADAHDAFYKLEAEIGKGRPFAGPVKGYEKLTPYSGYFPQKWSGSNIEKLIRAGRTEKDIIDAVSEAYVQKHGFNPKDAKIWASAAVRRARASEQGMDTNLIGILQQDGRQFLHETLTANGISTNAADRLIDKLTGEAAARGQAGHTKGRIDIDMRATSSNGIKLMDLFNTDVARMTASRARGTSGAAALARKGILSRTDRADIKQAILDEQAARGPSKSSVQGQPGIRDKIADALDRDKHLTPGEIDDMFSYFDSGPIGGRGRDARELANMSFIANAKKLTNLALLNGLGLTQMAEVGVQITAVGMKRWLAHAGDAIRGNALNPRSELTKELRHMNTLVPEERLFRDDLNVDMERTGPGSSAMMQKFSGMLNTGQRLQGYTSGYYAVRNFQQRVAVTSAADKIMRNMKGLANDLSAARAADIGLDARTFNRIKKYVDNGTVEFLNGDLHKLNFDKWKAGDVEDFSLALNRHVSQVIQKAMIGESSMLFHKDGVASLFFHLKSFTLLAAEKQAYRNLRMADQEAFHGFFAGLATAGAVYSIKQALNGNTQNLTTNKIATGAIGLSNMSGWLPMWTDPVAGMLGMDNYKINGFGRGVQQGVIGIPAVFTTLNAMAHIPGALAHMASGGMGTNDYNALKAAPIVGNAYGMVGVLNALKDHGK